MCGLETWFLGLQNKDHDSYYEHSMTKYTAPCLSNINDNVWRLIDGIFKLYYPGKSQHCFKQARKIVQGNFYAKNVVGPNT
jgi:hypothetical protein